VRLGYLTEGGVYWWGAVSKAFRTATRADRDMQLNFAVFPGRNGQLMVLQRLGNEHKKSEELLAWEVGLRYKFNDWWNFEVNGFYNDFDRLTTAEPSAPYCFYAQGPPPCAAGDLLAVAGQFGNEMNGHSSGIEMQMSYAVKDKLKLSASYSMLSQKFHLTPLSQDIGAAEELRRSVPKHQFKARLDWDILENVQLTASSYYSSPVQSVQTMGMLSVDNHWRFDARLGWRLLPNVVLYLSGISLFDKHYLEYSTNDGSLPTYIERSFSLGMQWQF
jgi:iron complex outermembrane receptor protein